MGRAVYEASARARAVFEEADRILGYKLSEICFNGPAERLDDTRIAQPAILTTSVALLEALAEDGADPTGRLSDGREPRGVAALPEELRPSYVAGHSLGEFSALVAAGVLTFSDALRLVSERGRLAATKGARGVIVFDGAGDDTELGPLSVRFVADADTLLERLAAEHRERERVLLVSSDRAVIETAGRQVAQLSSQTFFGDFEPPRQRDETPGGLSDKLDPETRARLERLRRGD